MPSYGGRNRQSGRSSFQRPGTGRIQPRRPQRPRPERLRQTGAITPRGPQPPAAGEGPKPTLGPAPGPPPGRQAPTPDSLYESQVANIEHQGSTTLENLGEQEASLKHETGIGDPTNPFSRLEGIKRSYLARSKGRSAALAGQGKLYSGTHERALGRTRREEEQERAELRASFDAAMNQLGEARAQVPFTTQEQKDQAFADWLERAPEADVDVSATEEEAAAAEAAPEPPQAPSVQASLPGVPANDQPASGSAFPGQPTNRAELARLRRRAQKKGKSLGEKRAAIQARKEIERQRSSAGAAPGEPGGGKGAGKAPPRVRPKPKPQARRRGRR